MNKKCELTKTVLVTGASGFLGRQLVSELLEHKNIYVIAMTSKKALLESKYKGFANIQVVDRENWKDEINQSIQTLINCSFPRSSHPEELAKGLIFTENFIKDVINQGTKNIINISSQSVYSQKRKYPATERSPIMPETLYGIAKYSSERIVSILCENAKHKVNYSNIRLASLAGVGFDARLTNRFVKNAIKGIPITIVGGKQIISYMDVKDAASGLIALLHTDPSIWKDVYNLGSPWRYTLKEIAEEVKKIGEKYGRNVLIEIKEKNEMLNTSMDSSLIYKDTGWRPKYDIESIIKTIFENYAPPC